MKLQCCCKFDNRSISLFVTTFLHISNALLLFQPLNESCTGWPFEAHAAEFYTKTMLRKFVEHIKAAASYIVEEIVPRSKYRLVHIDATNREKWCRGTYEVEIRENGGYYHCECGLWEHMGMLCCHSIRVS